MPVRRGEDREGPFYAWGDDGKRYRYTPGDYGSRQRAMARAAAQGRAIKARTARKAPASSTPAKPSERRRGSARNAPGSASGARNRITISEATEKALEAKRDAHNEERAASRRVSLGMLRAVYRRGAGAFSGSHSPRVSSREQWAMARVNSFLHLVRTGAPRNPKYTTDNDLLPVGHPRRKGRRRGS